MWPIFYCQVILRLLTDLLRPANRDQYSMHFFHILHDLKFEGHLSYVSCAFSALMNIYCISLTIWINILLCAGLRKVCPTCPTGPNLTAFYTKLNEI